MEERILIIEDDDGFRRTLVNLLQRKGYNVSAAKDGTQAIAMAKEDFFNLIIADVRLPGIDGIDTLVKIKESYPQEKSMVIMMTGYADKDAPVRAIKLGVDDYIYKPFKLEEFLHSVERNIKNDRLQREKKKHLEEIEAFNKEIAKKNETINAILSNMAEGVFAIDNDFRISNFNEAAERMTGFEQKEAIGMKCSDVFKADACKKNCFIKESMETGRNILDARVTITNKKGERIPILISASILKDLKGNTIGGVEIFRDVSKMNRLVEELKSSKAEISRWNEQLEQRVKERTGELEQAKEKVKEKTKELTLLFQIGRDVSSSLRLDEVLETIVNRVCAALDLEICVVLLLAKDRGELLVRAVRGLDKQVIKQTRLKMGEAISGWTAQHKTAVLVDDVQTDARFAGRNQEKYYTGSLISVALAVNDEVIGVINASSKKSGEPFTKDDLNFVKGVATEVVIAVENARLYTSLEETYIHTVMALTSAIDAKDHYTKSHSEHVTRFAVAIAKELNLSSAEVEEIEQAAKLHDLGKIGVHDYILTKSTSLKEEEWKEIKLHSLKSAEILKPLTFLGGVVDLVRQHHERFDGTGYPYGLKGEKIKLGARIMAAADSYDAMTTERPYRKALSKENAIKELKKNSGTQFDPKVINALLEVLKKVNRSTKRK